MSLEKVVKTRLIHLEDFLVLLLGLGCPCQNLISSRDFYRSMYDWKINVFTIFHVNTSLESPTVDF